MLKTFDVKPEQAKVLDELEKIIGKSIPLADDIKWDTFGVKIEENDIIELGLYNRRIKTLPESIVNLKSLKQLGLSFNEFTTLPDFIGELSSLEILRLYRNKLQTLPQSLSKLKSLKYISLSNNKFQVLPEIIGDLSSLEELYLGENQLKVLPESIKNLKNLKYLSLNGNHLSIFPDSISSLSSLKELRLHNNKLATIPKSIGNLSSLKELWLNQNRLTIIPKSIGSLNTLEKIDLDENQLSSLPESLSKLKSLKSLALDFSQTDHFSESTLRVYYGGDQQQSNVILKLNNLIGRIIRRVDEIKYDTIGIKVEGNNIVGLGLYNQGLTMLPDTISNLSSLEILRLHNNKLNTLPKSILALKLLQTLDLSNNPLTLLPEEIKNLTSLKTLELSNNQLTMLPESIGGLSLLQTLNLTGNMLTTLPVSLSKLKSLKSLTIDPSQLINFSEPTLNLYYGGVQEQSNVIMELNSLIGKIIRRVDEIEYDTLGVNIKCNYIFGLGLYDQGLTILPETLGKFSSLKELWISKNQLTTLPEIIGNFTALKELILRENQLVTLPESIGMLKSLEKLDLRGNKLTALPSSIWHLEKLKSLELSGNQWESEWEEMAKRDIPSILEFCRQKTTINIFISHVVTEFESYKIDKLSNYLENQDEVNKAIFCEEDLKGNIDEWMKETIPKCQLLLFIGTKQSILSKDCTLELLFARQNGIPIIPIKGRDISWEDLVSIGLSRELGFEFDEKNIDSLWKGLYKYIYKFKREYDLTAKEQDKIQNGILNLINLFGENLKTEEIKDIFSEKFEEIEALKKELKSKKIKFGSFMIKIGNLFKRNFS